MLYLQPWGALEKVLVLPVIIMYIVLLVFSVESSRPNKMMHFSGIISHVLLCVNMKIIYEDLSLCHRLQYVHFKEHWGDAVINPKLFQNTEEFAMLIFSIYTYHAARFVNK
jgi:hypothetical protein